MRRSLLIRSLLTGAVLAALPAARLDAVIFVSTGSASFNTTAPGGPLTDSGWQYQGTFGNFLGTPIASQYFITAGHIGGSVGQTFTINSTAYTTTAVFDDPNSDLRIWQISGTFDPSEIAPLYTGSGETGEDLVVFGRGTERGVEVLDPNDSSLGGWQWGAATHVQRWGTNEVAGVVNGGAGVGQLLYATFDFSANPNSTESTLSVGDSGGAVFILDGGTWKLAGINYAVTGPYFPGPSGAGGFNASLFDQSGYYVFNGVTYVPASGPGAFYSTRISSNLAFITSVIPEPGSVGLLLLGGLTIMATRRARRVSR